MDELRVRSGQGDYRVRFAGSVAEAADLVAPTPSLVFVDRNVLALHRDALAPLLAGRPLHEIPATEEEKTLAGIERATLFLQANDAGKSSTILAIGGGIVQDIATFTAHVYYRGIRWAFLPTTLLSMCDSSIGAKCGINLGRFKNQLGVFQSPAEVVIATGFLRTLADAEVLSGWGEMLKLALTGPPELHERFAATVRREGIRGPGLDGMIRECLEVKRSVIEQDEYELGLRKILNYGHTFGHALEAATGHEVPHGLAVAWGLDCANFVAMRRGLLAREHYERIHAFVLDRFPVRATTPPDAGQIVAAMRRDKKVAGGRIQLILPAAPGDLRIVPTDFDASLERQVADFLAENRVQPRD